MKKTILCLLLALGLLLMSAAAMADDYSFDITKGNITITNGVDEGTLRIQQGSNVKDNIDPGRTICVFGEYPPALTQLIVNATVPVKIAYEVDLPKPNLQSVIIRIADYSDVTLTLRKNPCRVNSNTSQPGIKLGSGSKLTIQAADPYFDAWISGKPSAILGPTDNSKPAATVILNSGTVFIHDSSGSGISGNVNLVINGGTFKANGKDINVKNLIVTGGELWAGSDSSTKVTLSKLNDYSNINCDAAILPDWENSDCFTCFGNLTLPVDLTIPEGVTLEILAGTMLTIPEGVTLTVPERATLALPHSATLIVNGALNGILVGSGTVKFAVKLNANGGTITGDSLTYYTYRVGATLPTDVKRTGYEFAGWYANEALTGDAVTEISATDTGKKTFWAKWTPDTYTVALNANGGTIGSGNVTGYTYGEGATLPTDVTRAGYTFAGWYDNEALTGDAVTEITKDATGEKKYWAKWTPDTYTVTLNANGGTIASGNVTGYTYGEGATLPTDVTRTGYTFAGWYDNSALTGDPVTAIGATETGKREYWAKWVIVLTDPDGAVVSGDAAFAKLPPVKVPTLVLPEGTTPGGSVMLKYVEVDTTRENTAVYDIYLVDQDGNRVKLPAACTLCLPYPEGLNQSSASAYRIHILHEMDGGRSEDFDSVSGGLELTAQGLCVRISSLSPFTITWERFPEVNLPQTGDSSRPALWLALGLVSAAALAAFALRGRKNGKA